MQSALAELVAEHRVIARVVRTLEHWADSAARLRVDGRAELTRFTYFFRRFGDDHHHHKEERILFEAMIEHGVPREEGPLGMMFREHGQIRDSMRVLIAFARQAHPWTHEDRLAVGEASAVYSTLLLGHMRKEDDILYPMVTRRLPMVLKGVTDGFARFRTQETGEAEYRRLLLMGESLVQRHGPLEAKALEAALPACQNA